MMLPSCSANYKSLDIEIIEEKSFFSDAKEQDGYVYYYCTLTLKNNTNEKKNIKLEGLFPEEYKKGIITFDKCYAVTVDGESDIVSIAANSEIEQLEIVFTCKKSQNYTGTTLKENRLLPDISIIEQ